MQCKDDVSLNCFSIKVRSEIKSSKQYEKSSADTMRGPGAGAPFPGALREGTRGEAIIWQIYKTQIFAILE